jgi:ribosomal protein L37AE/L43A
MSTNYPVKEVDPSQKDIDGRYRPMRCPSCDAFDWDVKKPQARMIDYFTCRGCGHKCEQPAFQHPMPTGERAKALSVSGK